MTNEKILKKAIYKAIKNGWVYTQRGFDYMMDLDRGKLANYTFKEKLHYPIIFSHDFAKAFWGEKKVDKKGYDVVNGEGYWFAWEYYLQQMVIRKEPLIYIERFL